MSDRALALALARAAVPYFQQQHDVGQSEYTRTRLETAKRTLQIMENWSR